MLKSMGYRYGMLYKHDKAFKQKVIDIKKSIRLVQIIRIYLRLSLKYRKNYEGVLWHYSNKIYIFAMLNFTSGVKYTLS